MAQFQQTVRRYLAAGIVGELAYHGPHRVAPGVLDGENLENAYVGRFYTIDTVTGLYAAGGEIDGTERIIGGIAIAPKEYVSYGNADQGPLGASLYLGNYRSAINFCTMGALWLSAGTTGDVAQGMLLIYSIETGEIQLISAADAAAGAGGGGAARSEEDEDADEAAARAIPEGFALVPNAVVYRTPGPQTTGGMYVAQLTN